MQNKKIEREGKAKIKVNISVDVKVYRKKWYGELSKILEIYQ